MVGLLLRDRVVREEEGGADGSVMMVPENLWAFVDEVK
jgi:hypothetical protein